MSYLTTLKLLCICRVDKAYRLRQICPWPLQVTRVNSRLCKSLAAGLRTRLLGSQRVCRPEGWRKHLPEAHRLARPELTLSSQSNRVGNCEHLQGDQLCHRRADQEAR